MSICDLKIGDQAIISNIEGNKKLAKRLEKVYISVYNNISTIMYTCKMSSKCHIFISSCQ